MKIGSLLLRGRWVWNPTRKSSEIFQNGYFGAMTHLCFSFGPFLLDTGRRVLLQDHRPVAIGQRGVAILEMLLMHAGDVVTKDALLNAAWPKVAIEESNLSVQIAALRRILGPSPDGEAWISTIQRVGYRFNRQVARRNESDRHEGEWAPTERLPREPSISVLPFANLSGDPAQDYFADGLTEDIITSLSRLRWLVVVARNSSFSYKGNEAAIAYLQQALQIDPTYARANALTAWIHAQRLNLGWDHMEESRDQALAFARLAVAEDPNDAWGHLALGYIHAMSRHTVPAIEALTASIALNPSFGFAHAMLGMAHAYAGAPEAGLQHVALALRLSPSDPQQAPYLSVQGLCHFLAERFAEAAELQQKVVEMRPHFVSAWRTLASARGLMGDQAAASAALAVAQRLQPSLSLAWIERYHPIVRENDRMIYFRGLQAAGLG